eukprot:TRINITY_DN1668_c0_g1_i17.p1 TRINITY_DN1668_c0_g1~~TRINITY_DN1668_c0_g1_i17.p1  ORF type:complete len:265 (-),score=68.28 TRINITY_DN1668_c0_g1_i17:327-1121(-)
MQDKANALKGEAIDTQNQGGNDEKALDLFTQALMCNPRSALLYACRGALLLRMKKPKAAIRDCDIAIRINPDSGKAYKVRGKAHRMLGHYEKARQDLQLGNKLDWDEGTYQLQKWVEGRLKAREDYERKLRERREQRKAPPPQPPPQQSQRKPTASGGMPSGGMPGMTGMPGGMPGMPGGMPGMPGGMPGMPGGMPGMPGGMPGMDPSFMSKLMSDPEVMAAMQDPQMMAKLTNVMKDPKAMAEAIKTDPKLAKLVMRIQSMYS